MSLIVFVVVTFGAAALAIALRARRPWALGFGLLGLSGAVIAALAIEPGRRWSSVAAAWRQRISAPLPRARSIVGLG
jgi:hypothetical protein